jgi:divalent metal cation (Fe/Co/Zn/Cd) transporter
VIHDVTALLGLGLVFAGCWWVYPPAALIVSGGILLAGSIWGHLNAAE